MKKVTEEWLKAAQDDLRVIEKITGDEYLTHMVAFHAQQCVEKSLKAVIEEFEMGSVRIHNLERLFELVRDHVDFIEDLDLIISETRHLRAKEGGQQKTPRALYALVVKNSTEKSKQSMVTGHGTS